MKIYTVLSANQDIYNTLVKYSNVPNTYVHFNEHLKLGIHPKASYFLSPVGIYCYPLVNFKESLESANKNYRKTHFKSGKPIPKQAQDLEVLHHVFPIFDYKQGSSSLNYGMIFTYTGNDHKLLKFDSYNRSRFREDFIGLVKTLANKMDMNTDKAYEVLQAIIDSKGIRHLDRSATYSRQRLIEHPASYSWLLWQLTRNLSWLLSQQHLHLKYKDKDSDGINKNYDLEDISDILEIDAHKMADILNSDHFLMNNKRSQNNSHSHTKMWTSILRELGYEGVADFGSGVIHRDESREAIFFTNQQLKLLEVLHIDIGSGHHRVKRNKRNKITKQKAKPINDILHSDFDDIFDDD